MSEHLTGKYHGTSSPLFWLVIKTSFLTLVTLGIYRFWAKTRIRKYLWSATSAGEDSFEYTGTGLEKFLGFLVAIVVLAIYLGIVQMVLLFFGLSMMSDASTPAGAIAQVGALYITIFAVMPLILFAQYRARRYKLARTRWRGLRFGMDNAAWGYVIRAIGHYLLTLLTLGILLPRQTFYLEKYMADRTWFGDAKFEQGGRWQGLYRGLKHLFYGLVCGVIGVTFLLTFSMVGFGLLLIVISYIWMLIGWVYYRIYTFNYMMDNKTLEKEGIFFGDVVTSEIVGTVIWGAIKIAVFGALLTGIFAAISATSIGFEVPQELDDLSGPLVSAIGGVGIILYVGFLLVMNALSFIWITQPIVAHVVDSVSLVGAEHLNSIQQRAADQGADAEGFADALDIGGGI